MTEIRFRSDVSVDLIDSMGNEELICMVARASTLGAHSTPKSNTGLIHRLMDEGHMTPFGTGAGLIFRFEVPIFVSRQIVKHRISSINEESGRYRNLEPVFYVPGEGRKVVQKGKTMDYNFIEDEDSLSLAQDYIIEASESAWAYYESLREEDIAKEMARAVLPVNLYSTMFMEGNLQTWLNFIRLRTQRYGSTPSTKSHSSGRRCATHSCRSSPTS